MKHLFSALFLAAFLTGCAAVPPAPPPESPEPPPAAEVPTDPAVPALPEAEPVPETEPPPEPGDFVRVADHLPEILVELRYAGENNFTGQKIYDFTDAYLRYGTVQKLAAAQAALAEQGYTLLIWDAFRPAAAQFRLWEICPDPVYVADPRRGFSSHSRGNTVDLTLVTLEGEPVEMPTGFDDFSPLADRDYSDVPEAAAANARLLEEVMASCGFRPYQGEWWHFSDSDSYPVEETFSPAQETEEADADHGD